MDQAGKADVDGWATVFVRAIERLSALGYCQSWYPSWCPSTVVVRHQQNVNRSGSHRRTSLTLQSISPVFLSTTRYSQIPLEQRKVLSDSTRAFSSGPESTCSYGAAFRMLQDLTNRIDNYWSSWYLCADLWETLRASETSVQAPL